MQKPLYRTLEEREGKCYGDAVKELSHLETASWSGQQSYGVEIRICIFICFYANINSRGSLM